MSQIVDFLSQFRPAGPWWLVKIKDGELKGEIFTSAERAEAWALASNKEEWNIYYHINPHKDGISRNKALKQHIARVEWLYADIDPNPKNEMEQEQAHLLRLASESTATLAVFSGNGIQLLWKLEEARPVGPEVEADIIAIGQALGGDSVQNADRVFRLPWTTNWPNERKRALGRTPTAARILKFNESTWNASTIIRWARSQQPAQSQEEPAQGEPTKLDEKTAARMKELSEEIREPGQDRSKIVWKACNVLLRAGIFERDALNVILSSSYHFMDHLQTRRDVMKYARRHIRRVWDEDSDPRIASLNTRHFYADVGSKPFIWEISRDGSVTPKSPSAFLMRYGNIQVVYDVNGKERVIDLGNYWLKHPRRRSYPGGVVFLPGVDDTVQEFNTWEPIKYEPIKGDFHKYWLEHVTDVICAGNSMYADHVLSWVAAPIQKPGMKLGTSIVMKGEEGGGKGSFVRPIGMLYGKHYLHAHKIDDLIGRFNRHLQDKLFVYADEVIWGGLKGSVGMINALITERVLNLEQKHVDMQTATNYFNIVFASNADWVVPASSSARRYFVVDVEMSASRKAWLNAHIHDPLNRDPTPLLGSLLQFLLQYDVSKFDPYSTPITDALRGQQQEGWNTYTQYAFDVLDRGYIGAAGTWPSKVEQDEVWREFQEFSRGGTYSRNNCIRQVRRLLKGSRYRGALKLPPLHESRAEFEKRAGGVVEWSAPPANTAHLSSVVKLG